MGRGPSIEGRKNAEDAKRAKVFTKLIREITIATRGGAPDPAANPRLRAAVDKALAANMTKDTIERAIKRGSGAEGGADMHEVRYEGYGPAGTALIVDCVTDNQTRTVADVRAALNKNGGNMGTTNSVAFQFTRVGQVVVQNPLSPDGHTITIVRGDAYNAATRRLVWTITGYPDLTGAAVHLSINGGSPIIGSVLSHAADGGPQDVAVVVAFLASPKSVAINGDVIAVAGGVPGVIHY